MKSLAGVGIGGTFTDLAFWNDARKTVFLHKDAFEQQAGTGVSVQV